MRKYSELGMVYRCEPCEEYPGEWIVYKGGAQFGSFPSKDKALECAVRLVGDPDCLQDVSVCWASNDNDPRIGKVWFTPFYELTRYDASPRF